LLEFPRQFPQVSSYTFGYVEQSDIPDEVKDATCEEALAILKFGNSARTKAQEQNVISVRVGDASETYKAGSFGKMHSKKHMNCSKVML